jgi:hypothetical protein
MCKCGYPRAAHTLRKVVKRKKTTKRSSSRRTPTTSRRTPTKEASKNEKKKKKVIVVKEKESYEPDSIFNDDNDVSTSDVPSIFEGRSPSPIPPMDPIELSESKEEEEKEEVTEQQDEIQEKTEKREEEVTEKKEEEEKEEEVTEQKDKVSEEKEDEDVNRSDSLNMQEIYLISKESNSLFEGLLENNNDDEDEEEEYDVTENTTTDDDTRRTVEWGSAFNSGSSTRVSQLESENKTLRRRLVMTASKVKSLEVELALANSKKVKRKRQSRTSSDGSKRDVLEDVCKRLLGSGFHQSRVRQALRVRNTEALQHVHNTEISNTYTGTRTCRCIARGGRGGKRRDIWCWFVHGSCFEICHGIHKESEIELLERRWIRKCVRG